MTRVKEARTAFLVFKIDKSTAKINYTQINSTTARRHDGMTGHDRYFGARYSCTRGTGVPDWFSRAIRDCPRCIRTRYPDTVFAVFEIGLGKIRIHARYESLRDLVTNIAECQYDTILLMD